MVGEQDPASAVPTMFFIPQMPYVFKGTLVENLAYPFYSLFDDEQQSPSRQLPGDDEALEWRPRRRSMTGHHYHHHPHEGTSYEALELMPSEHDIDQGEDENIPLRDRASSHRRRLLPLGHWSRAWRQALRRTMSRLGSAHSWRSTNNSDNDILRASAIGAERVRQALEMAGLVQLHDRYAVQDGLFKHRQEWDAILSPGEKQRLNFARLFLRLLLLREHQPPATYGILSHCRDVTHSK